MPPPGARRPDAAVIGAFAESMETRLDRAAALNPNPGRRPFQRLNRAEYERAVHDLLALDVDVTAFLPPDTISAGFDNVADVQNFSATLMEGYLRAASRISSLAVGDPRASAAETTVKVPRTASQMRHVEGAPFGTRGGVSVMHTFPADGEYVFRMQLHSIPTGQLFGSTVRGELIEVSIDGERVAVLEINPRMSEADPNGMNIDDAAHSRQGRPAARVGGVRPALRRAGGRPDGAASITRWPTRRSARASASRRCRTCASSRSAGRSRSPASPTRRAAARSSRAARPRRRKKRRARRRSSAGSRRRPTAARSRRRTSTA